MKLNLKLRTLTIAMLGALSAFAVGCDDADESTTYGGGTVYFTGTVYDGTNQSAGPLTNYEISLHYAGQTITGSVDSSGRYRVGPLEPYHDYTIVISAPGFDDLESTNPKFIPFLESEDNVNLVALLSGDDGINTPYSAEEIAKIMSLYDRAFEFNFVGHLIPTGARAEVSFQFGAPDSRVDLDPSEITGKLHLLPLNNTSALLADDTELAPVAQEEADTLRESLLQIDRNYWKNDAVILNGPVVVDIAGGQATANLILGVEYGIAVFMANGLQFRLANTVIPGIDSHVAVNLEDTLIPEDIEVVYNSADYDPHNGDTLTIVFNQPVEIEAELGAGQDGQVADGVNRNGQRGLFSEIAEVLDDNVDLVVFDENQDGTVAQTAHASGVADAPGVQENGVSFNLQGNRLTVSINRASIVGEQAGELHGVTFSGLNNITIRPAGQERDETTTVGALVGNAVTINFELDGQ